MAQTLPDSLLERAVERYEKAIASLETAAEDLSVEHVLDVLIARDAVQVAMSDKTQHHSGRLIKAVKDLDNRLKEQARYINRVTKLAEWQAIFNPPEKEWWWLLDPITPKPWRDQFDWLWRFFSLVFLTASLSLVVDISTRFLSGGPDIAGAFAVIIPSILTLLAGEGALTKRGQEGIEYILTSLKLEKAWWDEIICLAAGLLLWLLFVFWSLIPWIADNYYVPTAAQAAEYGRLNVAEEHYNRALKLNPENTEIYYKLGQLYEEAKDYNKAIENYKTSWKGKAQAASDIARLYLQQQNYRQADDWLQTALEPQIILLRNNKAFTITRRDFKTLTRFGIIDGQNSEKLDKLSDLSQQQFEAIKDKATLTDKQFDTLKNLVYFYLKNGKNLDSDRWLYVALPFTKNDKKKQAIILAYQGWSQLKQGRYPDAETQLRNAVSFDKQFAISHCLLAQVLEKQKNQAGAKTSWEQCVKYASQYNPDENTWISLALKSLASEGKSK
ncbi:tetratricopeptide repeat protein [Microseira wollei]|uniref:Tetratricopeptide TPR_2 n=1 Tax=Microseira wollei NIES-4236 TaxID=2530354 RepID=A0AAV3XL60_9CYAN|nr:tetratricopeptide repeat protein [Microseira wollei]GET41182.1 tetratricopeptide TPR_2 [Microseira wollei NIES-4236]